MPYTSMTEIEAINEMLMRANLSPVNSLDSSGGVDVEKAQKLLESTSRSIQMRGYSFNSDMCLKLVPDNSNQIIIPSNTLKIDSAGQDIHTKVTARDGILRKVDRYDGANPTEFTSPLYVDIVYYLPFEEIPMSAQWYITMSAALRFAQASLASGTIHQMLQEEVVRARVDFEESDGEEADFNMLDTMPYVGRRQASSW